jgi:cbb3-type cytochrome c oxidase subunit III
MAATKANKVEMGPFGHPTARMCGWLAAGVLWSGVTFAAQPDRSSALKRGLSTAAQCAACHGVDGNTASAAYPNLAGQLPTYLKLQLLNFKSGERPNAIMKAIATNLTDAQIGDVSQYFGSLQVRPQRTADKSLAARGQIIFTSGGTGGAPACAGCHGKTGHGQEPYPRIASQPAAYTVEQLTVYRTVPTFRNPLANLMKGVATKLSDSDVQAVAAYIAGMR